MFLKMSKLDIINLETEFISFSKYRNGYFKEWIENHFKNNDIFNLFLNPKDLISLIFMTLILVRVFLLLLFDISDDRLLLYLGSPWHHLGGNRTHGEILFLLWTINFIAIYLFVINSPSDQFKWIEVVAFLGKLLNREQIGI